MLAILAGLLLLAGCVVQQGETGWPVSSEVVGIAMETMTKLDEQLHKAYSTELAAEARVGTAEQAVHALQTRVSAMETPLAAGSILMAPGPDDLLSTPLCAQALCRHSRLSLGINHRSPETAGDEAYFYPLDYLELYADDENGWPSLEQADSPNWSPEAVRIELALALPLTATQDTPWQLFIPMTTTRQAPWYMVTPPKVVPRGAPASVQFYSLLPAPGPAPAAVPFRTPVPASIQAIPLDKGMYIFMNNDFQTGRSDLLRRYGQRFNFVALLLRSGSGPKTVFILAIMGNPTESDGAALVEMAAPEEMAAPIEMACRWYGVLCEGLADIP